MYVCMYVRMYDCISTFDETDSLWKTKNINYRDRDRDRDLVLSFRRIVDA